MDSQCQWTSVKQLSEKYEYFLLDCDGVLWSGDKQIDQAFYVIKRLVSLGKQVFFISNSSGKTREDSIAKIKNFGYEEACPEQVYGSAYVVSQYIKETYPNFKKIRVVGLDSIKKELAKVGIDSVGGEDEEGLGGRMMTMDEFEAIKIDPEVKAVVAGLDQKFSYNKLCLASLYINTGKAKFIATNDDSYDLVNGRKLPGAGAIVEAIQTTLDSAGGGAETQRPTIIGKPNPFVIDLIAKQHNISDRSKMVMIGDRPDTDILLGYKAGIDTCHVMTGVVSSDEEIAGIIKKDKSLAPTYRMKSFGVFE